MGETSAGGLLLPERKLSFNRELWELNSCVLRHTHQKYSYHLPEVEWRIE